MMKAPGFLLDVAGVVFFGLVLLFLWIGAALW
jgi:hypothetical protein